MQGINSLLNIKIILPEFGIQLYFLSELLDAVVFVFAYLVCLPPHHCRVKAWQP